MRSAERKANLILLLAAAIWGFAFVAQRIGMQHVGPFTFNAVRFALGAVSMACLLALRGRWRSDCGAPARRLPTPHRQLVLACGSLGLVLFIAASLQQFGVIYTSAGNAGFITGLYVIIVPLLGLVFRQRAGAGIWIGAVMATIGLYLLSVTGTMTIARGDLLVLISAFFWAGHVLIIGWLSPRIAAIKLACIQFSICSALSFCGALLTEQIIWRDILRAAAPILYAGILSVGVAYTLQIVAQKTARPAPAAIILSLEAVFAVLGGWVVLGETLALRGAIGCALMLAGMLVSQLVPVRRLR